METRIALLAHAGQALRSICRDCTDAFKPMAQRGESRVLITMPLAMAQWACRYSIVSALLAAAGIPVNPVAFFALQWLVGVLSILVPIPGGTMVAEEAFYAALSSVIPGDLFMGILAGWRFLGFYWPIILASMLLLTLNLRAHTYSSYAVSLVFARKASSKDNMVKSTTGAPL